MLLLPGQGIIIAMLPCGIRAICGETVVRIWGLSLDGQIRATVAAGIHQQGTWCCIQCTVAIDELAALPWQIIGMKESRVASFSKWVFIRTQELAGIGKVRHGGSQVRRLNALLNLLVWRLLGCSPASSIG